MPETILSIGIPTYKRPKQFKKMLLGILPQMVPGVEIFIRDDSPDEETKEIVDKYLRGSQVDYTYIQGSKMGLDLANLFLLENTKGKYLWWFSDDDEMMPGAVQHVLEILKKHPDTNYIWANFRIADQSQPVVAGPDRPCSAGELLDMAGTGIGLLSSFIPKRELALPYVELGKKYAVGFGFSSVVACLGAMTGPGRCFFMAGPYVVNHPTTHEELKEANKDKIINDGWRVYGVIFNKIMREFKDKIGRGPVRRILKKNFGFLWRGMLVGWIGGWDTPKGKRWEMLKMYWSFPEFWLAWPFFFLPVGVNAFFYRLFRMAFRR